MGSDFTATFKVNSLEEMALLGSLFANLYLKPVHGKHVAEGAESPFVISAYGPHKSGKTEFFEGVADAIGPEGKQLVARIKNAHIALDQFPTVGQAGDRHIVHHDLGNYWYMNTGYGNQITRRQPSQTFKTAIARTAYGIQCGDYGSLTAGQPFGPTLNLIEHATLPVLQESHAAVLIAQNVTRPSTAYCYMHVLARVLEGVSPRVSQTFRDAIREVYRRKGQPDDPCARVVKVVLLQDRKDHAETLRAFSLKAKQALQHYSHSE